MKKRKKQNSRGKVNLIGFLFIVIVIILSTQKCLAEEQLPVTKQVVLSNDTLWDIAQSICQEKNHLNIQNVILDIKELNQLSNSVIYTGQTLYIPEY